MPDPDQHTGIRNPYTHSEVNQRLQDTLAKEEPIIVACAGTGVSAKFIEEARVELI